jgi:hypothetical protein
VPATIGTRLDIAHSVRARPLTALAEPRPGCDSSPRRRQPSTHGPPTRLCGPGAIASAISTQPPPIAR